VEDISKMRKIKRGFYMKKVEQEGIQI